MRCSIWLLVLLITGCSTFKDGRDIDYVTVEDEPLRDRVEAERLFQKGLVLLDEQEWEHAEQLFTQSLAADVTFMPAHLALGKVYFLEKRYYLAAWEFEYAQSLNPERAEAYNNLGLVFEAVGRMDAAIDQYTLAYSMREDSFEYLGNMVRARIRQDDRSEELRYFIEQLVFIDPRPDWRAWGEMLLTSTRWNDTSMGGFGGGSEPMETIEPQPNYGLPFAEPMVPSQQLP